MYYFEAIITVASFLNDDNDGINVTQTEWRKHIEITSKRNLVVLKRNLVHAFKEMMESACKALVCPQAKYCAAVQDSTWINLATMIQRRLASLCYADITRCQVSEYVEGDIEGSESKILCHTAT